MRQQHCSSKIPWPEFRDPRRFFVLASAVIGVLGAVRTYAAANGETVHLGWVLTTPPNNATTLHSVTPSAELATWVDIGRPLPTCTEVVSTDSADYGRPRSTDLNPGKKTLPT
ncbi:hypothetical protein B0H13DRAFT_1876841 [Mycena leptocephala]|nr:hypothetical protein B0H13DRAFT_1876841 [Mycena leptocephala]